jgi:hypothetical protein
MKQSDNMLFQISDMDTIGKLARANQRQIEANRHYRVHSACSAANTRVRTLVTDTKQSEKEVVLQLSGEQAILNKQLRCHDNQSLSYFITELAN